ncbi:MAG: DUF3179 domain-containing (seleno)protein [Actinomycetota bacterium]
MSERSAAPRLAVGLVAVAILLAACGPPEGNSVVSGYQYPPAPPVTQLTPAADVVDALQRASRTAIVGELDEAAIKAIGASGDPRNAWFLSDLLRFTGDRRDEAALLNGFVELTGVDPKSDPTFAGSTWQSITNHLIAWDLPAPDQYRQTKAPLFLAVEPRWEPFFSDETSQIDWRLLSWGGVFIDDRQFGDPNPCARGCIPALDNPELTEAAQGNWYDDDAVVFGLIVGDQVVALPKNIMEVHEMVNLTLAGRRLAIPYCTLCGSAQAFFTDSQSTPLVMRTSGLLSRSNKVMYELESKSVFNTFTGKAISGPLHDQAVQLEQTTIFASTWGEWKATHPQTRIVAEDGGIGARYPKDPLRGRDDNGPIFPIGQPDPRLPVQAKVVGVTAPDGSPVAFPSEQARAALGAGKRVELRGVSLSMKGGGLEAQKTGGASIPAHESFWFAWSQFNPGTALWTPLS